jgi:hypothetical protein
MKPIHELFFVMLSTLMLVWCFIFGLFCLYTGQDWNFFLHVFLYGVNANSLITLTK